MAARKRPGMSGLLDGQRPKQTSEKGRDLRKPAAVGLSLGIFGAFIIAVTFLGELVVSVPFLHPLRGFMFPILAVATIVLIIPLVFYMSFQEEFSDLNPVIPSHYIFLLKKAIKAIKENDFKVEAKNM